jgi:hypothetical protein
MSTKPNDGLTHQISELINDEFDLVHIEIEKLYKIDGY